MWYGRVPVLTVSVDCPLVFWKIHFDVSTSLSTGRRDSLSQWRVSTEHSLSQQQPVLYLKVLNRGPFETSSVRRVSQSQSVSVLLQLCVSTLLFYQHSCSIFQKKEVILRQTRRNVFVDSPYVCSEPQTPAVVYWPMQLLASLPWSCFRPVYVLEKLSFSAESGHCNNIFR